MISDVLADAIVEIDKYLNDPAFRHIYRGSIASRIYFLRNNMEEVRQELDDLPDADTTVRNAMEDLRDELDTAPIADPIK